MVNGDDVLRVTTTRRWYRRIHEDAAAERILASMILIITLPLLSHSRRAENGNHLASLADVDPLLRGLVRTNNVCHAGRVQEVLNRLVAVANRAGTALALAESAVVQILLLLVLRGIGPQQVVRQLLDLLGALVRGRHAHSGRTRDHVDAVQRGLVWRQRARNTAVDAENHVVDGGGEGQIIKDGIRQHPDALSSLHSVAILELPKEAATAVEGLPAVA